MRNRHPSLSPRSSDSPHNALLTAAVMAALATSVPAQVQFTDLPRKGLPGSGTTISVALGDVDGDGDLDIVCATNGQNRLFLNDGTGTYADATASRMPVDTDNSWAVVFGDVNGDGNLDLVMGNQGNPYTQRNRLYLNNGFGAFYDATVGRLPVDADITTDVVLGDVDGDSDLDVVIGNLCDTSGSTCVGGQNRLYLNNGAGTFTDATLSHLPISAEPTGSAAIGDVDGDGDLDLVFGNTWTKYASSSNRLYRNDGTGTFVDDSAGNMPNQIDSTTGAEFGDLDGDGDLDLVLANGGTLLNQNRVLLNDGLGAFTDVTAIRMPVSNLETNTVALGDVDGDADLDMVFGNGFSYPTQDQLYLNLQRHFHAPVDLVVGQAYTLDAYLRYGPASQSDLALPAVSFAPASIQLPHFGTLGIHPGQIVGLPLIVIPQPAGVGSLNLQIVNDPNLTGTTIYTQALLYPQPFQAKLSNVVFDVLQ